LGVLVLVTSEVCLDYVQIDELATLTQQLLSHRVVEIKRLNNEIGVLVGLKSKHEVVTVSLYLLHVNWLLIVRNRTAWSG
jgi:hypothetical protein